MIEIVAISLENEMDLVLAHKRSMRVAEKLGLTIATQTTFATAVSEIARIVIEHTDNGVLKIGLQEDNRRYSLKANICFDSSIKFTNADEGFYYAQKLVPEFNLIEAKNENRIEMKIGVPRSLRLDPLKIAALHDFFLKEPPINAYEEIKQRNLSLLRTAEEHVEEIKQSKIIDEKKNEFISMASHEIKTPITIIKAYTEMVKASKEDCSDKVKGILDKIDYQSSKLLSLVHQLLEVSKMENGRLVYAMETVEFNPFIQDMVAVMKHILPDHEVITTLGANVTVNIDKLRMEQVFSNLLGNAAKYSEKNTLIKVDCYIHDDRNVIIAVTDQGIGMSKHNMHSIFEKFYRNEDVLRTHAGLGMGLYIASKIVSDHGGRIWVESSEGEGSTFYFTLPYVV